MHETGPGGLSVPQSRERLRQASQCARGWGQAPIPPPTTGPRARHHLGAGPSALSGLPDHPPLPPFSRAHVSGTQTCSLCPSPLPGRPLQTSWAARSLCRAPLAQCSRTSCSFCRRRRCPALRSLWMPCSLLSSMCSHHHRKEALKAGKPHCPGGWGPASSPPSHSRPGVVLLGHGASSGCVASRWPSPGPWLPQQPMA